jgi:hypothetical protein
VTCGLTVLSGAPPPDDEPLPETTAGVAAAKSPTLRQSASPTFSCALRFLRTFTSGRSPALHNTPAGLIPGKALDLTHVQRIYRAAFRRTRARIDAAIRVGGRCEDIPITHTGG